MFKSLAALAGIASAQHMPTLIEAVPNDKYDVVISQTSGGENFTLIDRGTYADPNPMCKNCTEKFFIEGVWNVDAADLAKVNFTCKLMGAVAYSADYDCTGAGNDYGNCPTSEGLGSDWKGDFGFDVPPIAPPFEYFVTITAYNSAGATLWTVESDFYIQ